MQRNAAIELSDSSSSETPRSAGRFSIYNHPRDPEQLKADRLYQQALQTDPIRAQILFQQLHTELAANPDAKWTQFYLGQMHYHGYGVDKDQSKGIDHLLQAAQQSDYQAINEIFHLLFELKEYHQKPLSLWLKKLEQEEVLDILYDSLNTNNLESFSNFNRTYYLAWFYRFGIHVEMNKAIANGLYLDAIREGYTPACQTYAFAREALIPKVPNLPYESYRPRKDYEQLIKDLTDLIGESQNDEIKAELHMATAWCYVVLKNRQEKINHFKQASKLGHLDASIYVAKHNHLSQNEAAQSKACQTILTLAQQGHKAASINLLKWLLEEGKRPLDELITTVNELHPENKYHIAAFVAQIYINESVNEGNEAILDHPHKIWRLQFAAQTGCKRSLNKLSELSTYSPADGSGANPYVCCALGLLHHYGILKSSSFGISHDKASRFFHMARDKDRDIFNQYIRLGHDEGLICDKVKEFLESQMVRYQPGNQ